MAHRHQDRLDEKAKKKMREKLLSLRGRLNVKDVSEELEAAELKDAKRGPTSSPAP